MRHMTGVVVLAGALAATLVRVPARAQQYPEGTAPATGGVDLSGEWTPVREEDHTGNTELGDWVGIPMNDAARLRAMAWVASIQTLPEWQCRPHAASYISRGPSQLRISKSFWACCSIVNGPGTVIFVCFFVCARRNLMSSTSTARRRSIFPVMRGTGFGWPERSSAVPGLSRSTPSSAVANRFE